MKMYCGIDLHSNNSVLAIKTEKLDDVACRRFSNDLDRILGFLNPYKDQIERIAIESTYNWYWLVDGLMDAGYGVGLVNTSKSQQYNGLKYLDDRHDARWIAHLLALGILPEGFIVPREDRAVRDLLRRRSFLVGKRVDILNSLQNVYSRNTGKRTSIAAILKWTSERVHSIFGDRSVVESIMCTLPVVRMLNQQIKAVERAALEVCQLREEFKVLKTAPGIGEILAMTIMCETSDIGRFPKVGHYVSYCRCAKSEHRSNDKKKGAGNRKNGNKYLSWAYAEAAHHMRRWEPRASRFHDRKIARRCFPIVARRALAAKIARCCYFMLRHQAPFDARRAFSS